MTEPMTPDPDPTELPVGDVDEPAANPQSSESVPEVPNEEVEAFFTDEDFESEPEVVDPHLDQFVGAIVVVHDGMTWLPIVIAALRAQERPLQKIVVVDTGSQDQSSEFLLREFEPEFIVTMPRKTSFPDAVAAGVTRVGSADWLWILHDDSAPKVDALLQLVAAANSSGADIVGPKVLGWNDRTHLLEIGITIGLGGRRETGLERGERDQGQHDRDQDVLAVGSAGMLIKSTVWKALDGFDPFLPMFRDDVDLGWRANSAGYRVAIAPRAVVHHAEAATHRRRPADAVNLHPRRSDRLNAMRVVLMNVPTWQFPLLIIGLVLGSLFRSLGFVIGKAFVPARDEFVALEQLVTHLGALREGRQRRQNAQTVPHKEVAALLAAPGTQLRQSLDTVAGVLSSSGAEPVRLGGGLETGPGQDDAMEGLVDTGTSFIGRQLRRQGVWTTLALTVLALIAGRQLFGAGRLQGGALLPAPGGAADWWSAFAASWHAVSVGSSLPAPPSLVILATASLGFLSSASALIDALVILAVPLAYASAYGSLHEVVRSPGLRVWSAATYALLPAVTIAMSAGRVGTIVVAVLLPPLIRAAAHVVGIGSTPPGARAAWGTGLLLAVVGCFAPIVWLVAVVLFAVAAFTVSTTRDERQRLVIVCAIPLVVWLPWSLELLRHPQNFLLESGAPAPGLADPALPALSLFALNPGGVAAPWWIVTIGIIPAAVVALLRRSRREFIIRLWAVGGGCLVAAVVLSWITVWPPSSLPVPAWPGPMLLMAAAALLTAAAVGNEGSLRRLSATRFSLRQVFAGALAFLALMAPIASGVVWVARGVGQPVSKGSEVALPAFVALQSQGPAQPRTLVLEGQSGRIAYSLVRGSAPHIGDAEVAPLRGKVKDLDAVVGDLAAGRGGIEIQRLANYAIRFVLVNAPVPPQLAEQLDAAPGLARVGSLNSGVLWQINSLTARARFVPTKGLPSLLPASVINADGKVPAKWSGGLVILAESSDSGWQASLNGKRLKSTTVNGWAQGFVLPAKSAGNIEIRYVSPARGGWLVIAAIALVVVIVLALPARRESSDDV